MTVQSIQAETALHPQDITLTFMLLGFIRKNTEGKFLLAIDWTRVQTHTDKVNKSLKVGTRINLDPDALRWTPVISGHDLFRSPFKAMSDNSSPLKSPSSEHSTPKGGILKRANRRRIGSDTTTTDDEEQFEKSPRKPKKRGRKNLSGEYKGLDGGALNNIKQDRKRKKSHSQISDRDTEESDVASISKKNNKLTKKSKSQANEDDLDADDEEDEEFEVATNENSHPISPKVKRDRKTSSSKTKFNPQKKRLFQSDDEDHESEEEEENEKLIRQITESSYKPQRAAASRASHRISKDSRNTS